MFFTGLVLMVIGQLVSGDQQQQLALSSASVEFSQKLYQRIAATKSNIVFSPYSIHSALSMTSLGAREMTATQMKDTLGVTSMGNSLHTTYRELIQQYNTETNIRLYTGNALFINPQFTIVPEFIEESQKNYFAKVENIDMSANGGPEKPINDYIANKTENTIKNVLAPDSIDGLTVMLLVNTIFFNGSWDNQFHTRSTRSQDFYQPDGAVSKVNMMHQSNRILNIKRDDATKLDVAEFPFKGGRFSMYIALPHDIDGITQLESLMAEPGNVDELFTGLSKKMMDVAIPKFRIEYDLDLKSALQDIGIVDAFISGLADFTGITPSAGAYITQVIHKAMIDVTEYGTVASAATVVSGSFRSRPWGKFVADHPFLFFLRDKQTGQILFQGKFSG